MTTNEFLSLTKAETYPTYVPNFGLCYSLLGILDSCNRFAFTMSEGEGNGVEIIGEALFHVACFCNVSGSDFEKILSVAKLRVSEGSEVVAPYTFYNTILEYYRIGADICIEKCSEFLSYIVYDLLGTYLFVYETKFADVDELITVAMDSFYEKRSN